MRIQKIDELLKSETYKKVISIPDSGEGFSDLSRFVEYSSTNKNGWKIIAMHPVDPNGNPEGKEIEIKKFVVLQSANLEEIKKSITVALGAMGNQEWIDRYEFPSNKAYAVIYLGRIAIQMNDKYYCPIFEYPGSGKKGDSFWISATTNKGEHGSISYSARTVVVHPDSISNAELQHAGLAQLNASRVKAWQEANEKIKEEGGHVPRSITEREYFPSLEIVREPGEKTFFIIYRNTLPDKDLINFARSAVTGETFTTEFVRKGATENEGNKRERASHSKFFDLDPTDERLMVFKYFNPEGQNKNPALQPGWNLLTLVKGTIFKPGAYTQEHRDISVKLLNKPTTLTLRVKVGDKLKVPRIAKGSEKLPNRVVHEEAEVTRTENIPINKKRIAIRFIGE